MAEDVAQRRIRDPRLCLGDGRFEEEGRRCRAISAAAYGKEQSRGREGVIGEKEANAQVDICLPDLSMRM